MNKSNAKKSFILKACLIGALVLLGVGLLSLQTIDFTTNQSTNLGTEIRIKPLINASTSNSIIIDGSILPNDEYEQIVKVEFPEFESGLVARINSYLVYDDGDKKPITFVTSSLWVKGDDGFFYYQPLTKGGEISNFSRRLIIPDVYLKANKLYSIIINIETLKYDEQIVEELWKTSPLEIREGWKESFNNI